MNRFILALLFASSTAFSQSPILKIMSVQTNAAFRGLSVINDQVAWLSGTNGWVGKSLDGGKNWKFKQVPGFEQFDFRSLYAFNDQVAIIANAGSPAHILRTEDGGETWKVVYKNEHKDAFFDGVDFWNDNEGMLYGDPIEGKLTILKTKNGGKDWQELSSRPQLNSGEASFAASGTGIRCFGKNRVMIATGGQTSRLWISDNGGDSWRTIAPPIIQGEAATGIFSVAFANTASGIVVGGNYQQDSVKNKHVFYTTDGGSSWKFPSAPTRGYRECVEYLSKLVAIAVGPTGIDITKDGGARWLPLSDEKKFHVVRKARKGSLVVVAGHDGRVGLLAR